MECPLCYELFEPQNIVKTKCNHVFCRPCFFKWSKYDNRCAMCRDGMIDVFWGRNMSDDAHEYAKLYF